MTTHEEIACAKCDLRFSIITKLIGRHAQMDVEGQALRNGWLVTAKTRVCPTCQSPQEQQAVAEALSALSVCVSTLGGQIA